jgi:dihydrofolate reductase
MHMVLLDRNCLQFAYRKDVIMGKVMVSGFSLSIDGYGAGPEQSREDPLGKRGEELHEWMVDTSSFHEMHGESGGSRSIDSDFAARFSKDVGAYILGRNMFGPVRGDWPDDEWKGWWGPNPPFHGPTFVLTHYPRAAFGMEGGTTFHFETEGIEAALEKAKAAAGGKNVTVGGGVATIRQYLLAGLIDELHFAMVPVLLGRGEALLADIDLPALGFRVVSRVATDAATHIVLGR